MLNNSANVTGRPGQYMSFFLLTETFPSINPSPSPPGMRDNTASSKLEPNPSFGMLLGLHIYQQGFLKLR